MNLETQKIDPIARTQFVELMRRFYSGRITNDEFEDSALPLLKNDMAVEQVFQEGAWLTYDDNKKYKLTGKNAISPQAKKEVARWILFLKSERRYEWPVIAKQNLCLGTGFIVLGLALSLFLREVRFLFFGFFLAYAFGQTRRAFLRRRIARFGAIDVWPYLTRDDYFKALAHPPFLIGKRHVN